MHTKEEIKNYKLEYLKNVLGVQSYLFPRFEIKEESKEGFEEIQEGFQSKILYRRGSLNAKWIFLTERPLTKKAFEILDKITRAIQAEKNFLLLSFNLSEEKKEASKKDHAEIERKEKALLFSIQKLISSSSTRSGIIFGFSLFNFFSNHLREGTSFDSKPYMKANIDFKEKLKISNVENRGKNHENKENGKNERASSFLKETLNLMKHEDSFSKTYSFFNLPFIVTYSLEALAFPDFFSLSKASFKPNFNKLGFDFKLKEENLDIYLRKKKAWNQIQNFMSYRMKKVKHENLV